MTERISSVNIVPLSHAGNRGETTGGVACPERLPIPGRPVPDASMTSDRITYLLRIWVPDRPGALGAVASRVGAVGGDIVAVDIVDRGAGQAVDDLVVELESDLVDLLVREIRAVDGVEVEEIHAVGQTPADLGLGVLAATRALVEATDPAEMTAALAGHACRVARLEWSAVCHADGLLAATGPTPDTAWLVAYARGIAADPDDSAESGPAEDPLVAFAAAGELVVCAGRSALSIRRRERQMLSALTDLAAVRWRELVAERVRD